MYDFLPPTYNRLGGIVPVSVLGGDSDRHSLAGLICRLVAFRSCTFCCLEPWMTCFHWCAGLKMSIFAEPCVEMLGVFDVWCRCRITRFSVQLRPFHFRSVWSSTDELMFVKIYVFPCIDPTFDALWPEADVFFGPALEAAKFGTF